MHFGHILTILDGSNIEPSDNLRNKNSNKNWYIDLARAKSEAPINKIII